jgi:hypothetical protein
MNDEDIDLPPHDRVDDWPDDEIHRIQISPRMLQELFTFGRTTSAGSSALGPELVVFDYVGDEPRGDVLSALSAVDEALGIIPDKYGVREDSDAE